MSDTIEDRTAFARTAEFVGGLVRGARLDVEALETPLARCDLSECQGTCCHDGVYLGSDEAELIRKLVVERRTFFEGLGLDLPPQPVVYGSWRNQGAGPKTATRAEAMRAKTPGYPRHFADTQCVFMAADRRCSLQLLAEAEGHRPWFYKPFTCWMHPLALAEVDGETVLTVHTPKNDPQNFADYDGFVSRTPCGMARECGEPAHQVLAGELEMLGALAGRDLCGELAGPNAEARA